MLTTEHDPILGSLNEQQKQAVLTTEGPVLILAGAGSGKTKALTHRIARLIGMGVQPWQILAVTFTNKAAKEMKERIANMLHITEGESHESRVTSANDFSKLETRNSKLPVMGTFHSICVRILRRDIERLGRNRSFVIYDGDDQEKMMKETLKEMRIDESELKARAALSMISKFKSEALNPAQARIQATSDHMFRVIQVYALYQKKLAESNAMDFDDLLLETVRLFQECPDILERYQETWRYIHVDEYQDTNHVQYLMISLLAKKYRNLCVIGDPDQSIYGFRGADIRNILEFEKEYKDAVRIKLERNYRSTQPILDAADGVIAANPDRPEKKMWTDNTEGAKVIINEVRDERREAEEAINAVKKMQADGVPFREQVILYRTHAQSRLFEEACMRAAVPYRILGGIKFYGRKEVKDVLAYLYAILNPYDTVSMLRIINIPTRKIGDTTMGKIQAFASLNSLRLWDALQRVDEVPDLDNGTKMRIQTFVNIILKYQQQAMHTVASDLAAHLIDEIKLETWLNDNTEEGEDRWHNVQELLTVMHKYDGLQGQESLMSFLEEVALVSEVDKLSDGNSDALTLMTLHLCKGLEFEHVIIVGCEEGLFPHSNSMFDKAQMEEERRIMYVGMTRARHHLRLMCAQSRFLWGENKSGSPSRFLKDLPEHILERRSDDILSAFAWAGNDVPLGRPFSAPSRSSGQKLEPFRQQEVSIEFNQDIAFEDNDSQDRELHVGSRVEHHTFGKGTVKTKRGDIAEIQFDSGQKKTFALSIAPLKVI